MRWLLKSKAVAPPARGWLMRLTACDDNRSAKSKQKRYRRVRRPARWARYPAVLTFAGGQRTRYSRNAAFAQTPLTRLSSQALAKPPLLGGYQAHPSQSQNTKAKPSSAARLSQYSKRHALARRLPIKPSIRATVLAVGTQLSGKPKQSHRNIQSRFLRRHSRWRC